MSREEVLRGAGLALRNAEVLLRDGRRLTIEPRSLSSANALFQFAIEEVGKAVVLCEHYRNLCTGLPVDGDALRSAFTDHKKKTWKALLVLEEVFKKAEGEYIAGSDIVEELIDTMSRYERVRQQSLYVDIDVDRFQAPIDVINLPIVQHTLLIANISFNFVNEYHMKLVDPDYTFLSRTSERIRAAGGPIAPSSVLRGLRKPS